MLCLFKTNKKLLIVIVIVSIISLVFSGCEKKEEGIVAKVNGEVITQEEFDEDFETTKKILQKQLGKDALSKEMGDNKTYEEVLREDILGNLIIEKILAEELENMNMSVTDEDVAEAIKNMVTQSGGPPFCAGYGMAQAARSVKNKSNTHILNKLKEAAKCLINTRPTNNSIILMIDKLMNVAKNALQNGTDIENALVDAVDNEFKKRHKRGLAIGKNGAKFIETGDSILNH